MAGTVPEDARSSPPAHGRIGRTVSPRMIGRTGELDQALTALSQPPAVVVIEGEAGIGKTRLLTELRTRPDLTGTRFLIGGCRQIREPFPLGPILEAIRHGAHHLPTDQLTPVAGALQPLLPELAHQLPARPEPLADRLAERHRVFRGLIEILTALGPAVLAIEDLHWADEQTIDFLRYLLDEPRPQLAVLLTFRAEEVPPDIRALTARLPDPIRHAHLVLQPLAVQEVRTLVAAVLGADRISEELANHLRQRSSGVPFAVLELLALLRERGQLARHGGRWVRRTLDELVVPAGVADPVRARVAGLTPPARAVVEAAAVLQEPATPGTLLAVCQPPAAAARDGLAEAVASGLLAEQPGGEIGFRHVLAAQAVYETIVGTRRQELHRRAAAAVSALDPVPLGQLAHHLRQAGRTGEWVAAAEAAADHAVALGNDAQAARLLEDVLRHAALDPDALGRFSVKLAVSAIHAPRIREITELLMEISERELPRAVRGELRFRIANARMSMGSDPLLVDQLLRDAVDDLPERPELQARAMLELGTVHGSTMSMAEHRTWLSRALRVLPDLRNQATEPPSWAAVALLMAADHRWRTVAERITDNAGGPQRRRSGTVACYVIGMVASDCGHHEIAGRLLDAGMGSPVIEEIFLLGLGLRCARADLDYYRGEWSGLRQRVDQLLDELTGVSLTYLDVESVAGCLRLADGEVDGARRSLLGIAGSAEKSGHLGALPVPVGALARLAGIREDPEAVAVVDRFVALVSAKGAWPSVLRALPPVVSTLVFTGRAAEAAAFLGRVDDDLRDRDAPLLAAAVPHARGLLDSAGQRWPEAASALLTAAGRYESLQCPYEAAQAREQAATALFALHDRRAEPVLRDAIGTYRRLPARWDLERAASLARRHGMPLPARHRGGSQGYGSRLSPREREVAGLVATGRTNREIAAELYLSVKTVEKHLSAALRKLGLRSRTALARYADEPEGSGVEDGGFPP